jgi:N-acetylglutamate synthase-like GNAT family acetyltransferase
MHVRTATYKDAPDIRTLLETLGYKTSISLLISQLENLFSGKDHEVLVCEINKNIAAFASVHFLPQLAFDGGLLIISYLSIDERERDQRVATALENCIVELARKRKCERIQVHCAQWRSQSHQFFLGQGYEEYPQYFTKRLMYGE